MSSYSVNKVILIGNLTRDPELRYTPQGTAVCSFGIATNRSWTTQDGDVRDETDFHNIVAWRKLAEICKQLLLKGRKVYLSGRLQTRDWTGDDGVKRYRTEVVIDEMIALDSPAGTFPRPEGREEGEKTKEKPVPAINKNEEGLTEDQNKGKSGKIKDKELNKEKQNEDINPDDIPF